MISLMISCGILCMATVLASTGMGRFSVDVFESVVGVIEGSRAPFLDWRLYEMERFAFEIFEPIRGAGRGGGRWRLGAVSWQALLM